jgi:hypothetical protein
MEKGVPESLRMWFLFHFAVDLAFGLPLLFQPELLFKLFGLPFVELLTARLLGAGLLGLGFVSLYAHKKGREVYDALLTMKIAWSLVAIFALLISRPILWPIVAIFVIFSATWIYYRRRIR